MNRYLTLREYEYYGGKTPLTQPQLDTFLLRFESSIHPNQWMLELWKLEHGNNEVYPYEIKLAIMLYIEYLLNNANQLENLPIGGSTVGSTSIDYVNSVANNFGKDFLMQPPSVKAVLKSTNIYSPRAYLGKCSGIRFIGTLPDPIPVTPTLPPSNSTGVDNTVIIDTTTGNANLHSLEDITRLLPSTKITIYERVRKTEGTVVTNTFENKLLGTTTGWFRNATNDANKYSTVIIKPLYDEPLGENVFLNKTSKYYVKYTVDGVEQTYTVQGYDQHLDFGNITHHYLLNLE